MPSDTTPWAVPPLSTDSVEAERCYRRGIGAVVAGIAHADRMLAEAIRIDHDFVLAHVGLAVARVVAGQERCSIVDAGMVTRGERQHTEVVRTALGGELRHAFDLRREHLLEFPGDLLIVWLPAYFRLASDGSDDVQPVVGPRDGSIDDG